jgi:hypothetical protein
MSAAVLYCALRMMQQDRERREARVPIGVPVIVPPQQMPGEHEAWVAIGVPLLEPRPHAKLSPYEMPLVRVRFILDPIFLALSLFYNIHLEKCIIIIMEKKDPDGPIHGQSRLELNTTWIAMPTQNNR